MEHFAGLDVSVKETSICIVDDAGRTVREVRVAERTRSSAAGAEARRLPLQADWTGSRTAVAVAFQLTCGRCCRRRSTRPTATTRAAWRQACLGETLNTMVLAQGLGDEDRPAPRDEEGDRGAGAPARRDHAPHMG